MQRVRGSSPLSSTETAGQGRVLNPHPRRKAWPSGIYSAIADEQLDALEDGPDPDLYNGALDACQLIFEATGLAQQRSTAINTTEGVRFRLPIVGHLPYHVFWSHTDDGPRVEAIFPHP